MKRMNVIILTIASFLLLSILCFVFINNGSNREENSSNQIYNPNCIERYDIFQDSSLIACEIERFSIESAIHKYRIILNDSICYFLTKENIHDSFLFFSLKKDVANYIRSLLYELYSTHKSVLLDGVPQLKYHENTAMPYLSIKIRLNGEIIQEIIPYRQYSLLVWSEDRNAKAFNEMYDRYWELINAISIKISIDIYDYPYNVNPTPKPWVTEMFHGEYYEPYNNINTNKY